MSTTTDLLPQAENGTLTNWDLAQALHHEIEWLDDYDEVSPADGSIKLIRRDGQIMCFTLEEDIDPDEGTREITGWTYWTFDSEDDYLADRGASVDGDPADNGMEWLLGRIKATVTKWAEGSVKFRFTAIADPDGDCVPMDFSTTPTTFDEAVDAITNYIYEATGTDDVETLREETNEDGEQTVRLGYRDPEHNEDCVIDVTSVLLDPRWLA